jgi:hypothetical protein
MMKRGYGQVVVPKGVGSSLFALVPGGEGRRPVDLEAGYAALA